MQHFREHHVHLEEVAGEAVEDAPRWIVVEEAERRREQALEGVVVQEFDITRAEDGTFTGVVGLV